MAVIRVRHHLLFATKYVVNFLRNMIYLYYLYDLTQMI